MGDEMVTQTLDQIVKLLWLDGRLNLSLFRYHGCLNNVDVQLFLMDQIAHDWPTDLNDYDIIAADEIWNFLKEFDINGKIAQ